jgi:predicted nucleic acid-binding protein
MKIYLETSVFGYYFDLDQIVHPATVQLFKEIESGKFEPYTSVFVIRELENAPPEKRNKMLELITEFSINILYDDKTVSDFADLYVTNNIIPTRYIMDARHIAISVINNLDMIVSLNFKHIVRNKTRIFTEYICKINDYKPVTINSPMEVIDNE